MKMIILRVLKNMEAPWPVAGFADGSVHQKDMGSIPSHGMDLGCYLTCQCLSASLSPLPFLPLSNQ